MSWAARRRFFILLIIGAVGVVFVSILAISVFYKDPTCNDGVMNQNETGIDCGGACQYLCVEEQYPPTVLFTKAIPNGAGRVDVIARVENKNVDAAAKNVPYVVTLYGPDQSLIQEITGTLDLPPGANVPVFVSGIPSGKQVNIRAFLEIDPLVPRWFYMSSNQRILPRVSSTKLGGTALNPRIEAILSNPSVSALANVKAIVLVRNEKGDVIAASSTVIPIITAQGNASVTFTWNGAFSSIPASIEIVPIVQLP